MYRQTEIRQHFPEAWIEDYEDLTPAMTNHPKDRQLGRSSSVWRIAVSSDTALRDRQKRGPSRSRGPSLKLIAANHMPQVKAWVVSIHAPRWALALSHALDVP